jgi:serine protease AprX
MPTDSTAPATTRWRSAVTLLVGAALAGATAVAPVPAAAAGVASPATVRVALHGSGSDFTSGKWGDSTADATAKDDYGRNAAQKDPGSLYTIETALGARTVWGKRSLLTGQRITGQNVGVALLDSGVTRVPGLDGNGKVTYGPDLSIEGNGLLANQDTFGHGTFMAGIIAGRGADNPSSDLASAPANVQLGVAPDADLLSLKLATTDGSTDVSQVIAALDWVTQHPVMPDGTPIRVVNLSYGTLSQQDYRSDPLAAAAENAWRHGLVVVVSAGNEGSQSNGLTDPAIDPYVLAVGAADSGDRTDWSGSHTSAASFSSAGDGVRNPDLVAPGRSVVSLRDPGSTIDANNPQGLVSGDTSGRLFRGSGSSQAAAVASGAAALLLQAYPNLTPDQVKAALVQSTKDMNGTSRQVGAGLINVAGALDAAGRLTLRDTVANLLNAGTRQSFPVSTGQGSIDAARGGSVLVDADGNDVSGEIDVQGTPWNPAAWWSATSSLTAWDGGKWLGVTWTGDGWQDDESGLASARWSSARWSSARWSSARWSDAEWSSARWSSARWSSARWSSARWSAGDW